MADAIRELFDSLASEGNLQTAVRERREENLHLEFKQKYDRRHENLDESDKKNFSKTLSGFANSDGGVLIFGIATKKSDGVDRASALKPIAKAERFLSRLQDSVLNATEPVVDDVDFRLIGSAKSRGAGYVALLIPASDKVPHRAVLADREYYRRTANGFRALEHIELTLEDMFGRRPRPLLRAVLELRPRGGNDPHEELHLSFLNEGRAIARYSGAVGTLLDETVAIVGASGEVANATSLNRGMPIFTFIDNVSVIHPNGIRRAAGHAIIRRPAKGSTLKVRLRWYCDNMLWKEEVVDLRPDVEYMLS